MNSLQKYIWLIEKHPEMFRNSGEIGEIKIIVDKKRILVEQRKIRARLKIKGKPSSWINIGVLSEDEWFYVVRDMVEFPDGKVGGYIRWINRKSQEGGGYNVVLMCVQGDQVLMIRRFRHEERDWSWEFPRGFGEPGLSAIQNARLELKEEIGIVNTKLVCLTKVLAGKGGTAVFLTHLPSNQEIILESHEGIVEYKWIRISKLGELMKKGQLSDWFSLWAYTLAISKKAF